MNNSLDRLKNHLVKRKLGRSGMVEFAMPYFQEMRTIFAREKVTNKKLPNSMTVNYRTFTVTMKYTTTTVQWYISKGTVSVVVGNLMRKQYDLTPEKVLEKFKEGELAFRRMEWSM